MAINQKLKKGWFLPKNRENGSINTVHISFIFTEIRDFQR